MEYYNNTINYLVAISKDFPEQGTEAWRKMREDIVTGTVVNKAMNFSRFEKRFKYPDLLPSKTFNGNKYTIYGNDKESICKQKYEIQEDDFVVDLNFIKHPKHPYIGMSPDGFSHKYNCLMEFKCPPVSDLVSKLKKDHFYQVQWSLHILNEHGIDTYCLYVVMNPDGKIHIRKVERIPLKEWWPHAYEDVNDYISAKREHKRFINKITSF